METLYYTAPNLQSITQQLILYEINFNFPI